ncbi:uncharacterized protein LOC105850966 isoform X2 [Hydra vulgaris]|uniref:uncharacterized protein LOC105850966 isoform X2 n=1 Tax=Hydra vulgaris TaxID=6087 RepID=UPI001F5FE866|nr:uncharacterized protein LOC105850966 isoform X2 [Hydra vulgaris]
METKILISILLFLVRSFSVCNADITLFSLVEEIEVIKNHVLTTLLSYPKEYIISFEIKPTSYTNLDWQNILHFTTGNDIGYAERNPAIFLDTRGILFIMSAINGSTIATELITIPLNTWTKVVISQLLFGESYVYTISVNNSVFYTTFNNDARNFSNVIVYACDNWYMALIGTIRSITIIQVTTDAIPEHALLYHPKLIINFNGFLNSTLLTLNLTINTGSQLSENVYNLTIGYLMPSFLKLTLQNSQTRFVRDISRSYFQCDGLTVVNESIIHSVSAIVIISNIPSNRQFTLSVPANISFENYAGTRWVEFKEVRIEAQFPEKTPLLILKNVLPESYGRGVYWDSTNLHIYVCMNQNVVSTETACYYSKDEGKHWKDLDICVGSIIGHHSITRELYAVHKNRKTYLKFHGTYKKWLALTNNDYLEQVHRYIESSRRKNLEDDSDQVFSLGTNQWMGNYYGLFVRKHSTEAWVQIVKWNRQ